MRAGKLADVNKCDDDDDGETDAVCCCTSRGYFIPFRLCSDPSDVALQRPQWKEMVPTRNLEVSPPPLTKNSPSTRMDTKTHTHNKNDELHWRLSDCQRRTFPITGLINIFAWLTRLSIIQLCRGCLATRLHGFVQNWIFWLWATGKIYIAPF